MKFKLSLLVFILAFCDIGKAQFPQLFCIQKDFLTNSSGPTDYTTGLYFQLKLNEGSGTVAHDSVGTNNLNTFGTPSWGSTYLNLNGSSEYLTGGTVMMTNLEGQDRTFMLWIKKTGSSQKGLIDKEFDTDGSGNPGTYGGFGFWIQSTGQLWWWTKGGADMKDNGPNAITLGSWAHVCAVWHASTTTVDFYINGTLNSTLSNGSASEQSSGTSTDFEIGDLRNHLNSGQFSFDGSIDDVRIYVGALIATNIAQVYNYSVGTHGQ